MKKIVILATMAASALAAQARAGPPLVAAYVDQLYKTCGASAPASSLIDRFDLNGDRIEDYVIDDGRQPCPARPKEYARFGSRVTIFLGRPDGQAYPAMQLDAFGAALERKPAGGYALWLDLGGRNCDSDEEATRCRREVVWRGPDIGLQLAGGGIP